MRGFSTIQIIIFVTAFVAGIFVIKQINVKESKQSAVNQQITNKESTLATSLNSPIPQQSSSPVPKQSLKPTPTITASQTPSPTPNPCRMGPPPTITSDSTVQLTSVSKTSGKVGDIIILKGSGFGKSSFYFPDPTKFLGGVSFYGRPCGYNSGGAPPATSGDWDYSWWTDNQVKVKVPGVSSGNFQVEVTSSEGKRSNRLDFQVLQ